VPLSDDIRKVYTVDGKRLDKPQKGVNIIDSKKVLMK